MTHEEYMQLAYDAAYEGMRNNCGGPFGAVIVLNDKVIGTGCNCVPSTNDPTAHAEVMAIRSACKTAGSFHIPDAILYTSCEPCPMCLAAIYWANIKQVYYGLTRADAERIDFDDKYIYDEVSKPLEGRDIIFRQINLASGPALFKEWTTKMDRVQY